jgi:glycosyltransferase involved in cell wall biosynthesis
MAVSDARERGPIQRTAVCVIAGGGERDERDEARLLSGLRSILEHTDAAIAVTLVATKPVLERVGGEVARDPRRRALLEVALEPKMSEARGLAAALAATAPADVALLTAGTRVAAGWLERLRAAAMSDSTVASATPLLRAAAHERDPRSEQDPGSAPGAEGLDELARALAERGAPRYPRIATAGPGCCYLRRGALELTAVSPQASSLGACLVGWAEQSLAQGLLHVLADDVLVEHLDSANDETNVVAAAPGAARLLVLPRGGELQQAMLEEEHSPLRLALERARAAARRLSVTIDGRALVSSVGGTQTYLIGLILALAQSDAVALRVLIPPDLSERAAAALAELSHVELISYEQALREPRKTDVVHRPQQVFTRDDFELLRLLGERLVIGHQDLIAYHDEAYHRDLAAWQDYRRTTRLTLGAVDQVVFFSEHARRDALAEDLIEEARTSVAGIGSEANEDVPQQSIAPAGAEHDGAPFLLCLSADYLHKNRPFAIELLAALRRRGWNGRLLLAGAHVAHGSSHEPERELLAASPELAEHVVDLGAVEEAGKRWLFEHAQALVYPTVYEGYGLLPLEAARAGLPCLFAAQASLSEIAAGAATLVPWDAEASAAAVLELLSAGPARERHLALLTGLPLPSWSEVARRLVAIYARALASPPLLAGPRSWQDVEQEAHVAKLGEDIDELRRVAQEYQDAYHELEARVAKGLPLIDRGGLLSDEQQRGLMRIAARGPLGALALAPFGLLGRGRSGGTNG